MKEGFAQCRADNTAPLVLQVVIAVGVVGHQPFQREAGEQGVRTTQRGGSAHGLGQRQRGPQIRVGPLLPGEETGEATIMEVLRCVGEQAPLRVGKHDAAAQAQAKAALGSPLSWRCPTLREGVSVAPESDSGAPREKGRIPVDAICHINGFFLWRSNDGHTTHATWQE